MHIVYGIFTSTKNLSHYHCIDYTYHLMRVEGVLRLCLVCLLSACVHNSTAAMWPQEMMVSQWCCREEKKAVDLDFLFYLKKKEFFWNSCGILIVWFFPFIDTKYTHFKGSDIEDIHHGYWLLYLHTHEWGEKLCACLLSWSQYKCLIPELLCTVHLIVLTQQSQQHHTHLHTHTQVTLA